MLTQAHIIRGSQERDFLFFPETFSLFAIPAGLSEPLSAEQLGGKAEALLEREQQLQQRLGEPPPLPAAPTSLCLYLAQDCNLACSYCYNDGGRAGGETLRMSSEVAQTALRRFFTRPGESYALSFYGGEPLLNRQVLEQTLSFGESLARERGFHLSFHMTTNATLIDDRVLPLLARFTTLTVSLDGPAEVHNRHRRGRNQEATHSRVLAGLRALLALQGPRVTLKGTLTAEGAVHYRETATYLNSLGAAAVGLTPVFAPPDHPAYIGDAAYSDYIQQHLAEYCDPESALEAPMQHGEALELISRILGRRRVHRHCHAGADLAVAADGSLYACHGLIGEETFRMGHVAEDTPGPDYKAVASKFAGYGVKSAEPCQRCFARYLCGGGCYAHGHWLHKEPNRPDPRHCQLERRRLERVLAGLGEVLQNPARRKRLQDLIGTAAAT
ncbi:MAG: radical SAM protein [Candidatus Thiodiazotropha sp.]